MEVWSGNKERAEREGNDMLDAEVSGDGEEEVPSEAASKLGGALAEVAPKGLVATFS